MSNNFNLSFYLPKDLINIVLDYIYKPNIEKLNQEYKSLYKEDYYNEYAILYTLMFRRYLSYQVINENL